MGLLRPVFARMLAGLESEMDVLEPLCQSSPLFMTRVVPEVESNDNIGSKLFQDEEALGGQSRSSKDQVFEGREEERSENIRIGQV